MWRRVLLRCFAPIGITLALCLPFAQAGEKAPRLNQPVDDEKSGERTPAFQYLMAAVYALGIMVVVCMPSRKG